MPATTNKLKYIKATDPQYKDLGEEIRGLHVETEANAGKVTELESQMATVQTAVQETIDGASLSTEALEQEIADARGFNASLNERLTNMDLFRATEVLERLTVARTYEYSPNGDVTKETVRGELNYDTLYTYDGQGNITKEAFYDTEGLLIGQKEYEYDGLGQLLRSSSSGGEVLQVVTNSGVTNELAFRLAKIEALDFVKTAGILESATAETLMAFVQEMSSRVGNLEQLLPANLPNLITLPYITDKLQELENRITLSYKEHEFDVTSSEDTYYLPESVTSNSVVYIDGLMLEHGNDYVITDGKIVFLIPLIDGFSITVKY